MGEIIHVVVEELLKLLVDKVDGDLLEAVVLEDLKTSNIEHSTEVGLLQGRIDESVVTLTKNSDFVFFFSCDNYI